MSEIIVAALYKFVPLEDFRELREPLLALMAEREMRGTLLLAPEGINGTVSGSREAVDGLRDWFAADPRFHGLEYKESLAGEHPFLRARVKLKREIVTFGIPGVDPQRTVGTYLSPREWDQVIADPETLVIDTRNQYEYEVGTFEGALNPATQNFREFPDFVREHLDPQRHRKVAMFCTGGIRCEKATAWMKEQGFEEVYHLKGGILKYLQETPEEESRWRGECFVFDDRVTVNHRLEPGSHDQCHACRRPVSEEDRRDPRFEQGISCPRCYEQTSDASKRRFAERRRQMQLARERGEAHLGVDPREKA